MTYLSIRFEYTLFTQTLCKEGARYVIFFSVLKRYFRQKKNFIKTFKTSDGGNYVCQISDDYGNANFSESYQVQVGSPPDYVDFDIKAEKLIFYPDSDPINLTCVAKDHGEQNNIEQYFVTLTGRDSRTFI